MTMEASGKRASGRLMELWEHIEPLRDQFMIEDILES
jgi:hypothetical protein